MTISATDEQRLKELVKSAFSEALEDNRDRVRQIVEEAIEDLMMNRAIEDGLASDPISREQIFETLRG
jgi:hypothetical protein